MTDSSAAAYEALIQFLYRAPIGLVQTTLDGEITMINPMSAQLLMPLARDGNLVNLFDVLDPVAPQLRAAAAGPGELGGTICDGLRMALPAAGSRGGGRPRTLALSLFRFDAGSLMGTLSDATPLVLQEEQRLETELRDATRIDSLTRMPNRAVVTERITDALHKLRAESGPPFAVLYINADRFSQVNLTLGQAAGDLLLQAMGARVEGTVRSCDAVGRAGQPEATSARLGGDEFVVVLDGLRSSEDVHGIAQRLVDALARPYSISGTSVHASASIGVVTQAGPMASADSVLQDASLAMHEAKRAGGARWCLFEQLMKDEAQRRSSVESELRQGLLEGQLFVVYQPIVPLSHHGSCAGDPARPAGGESGLGVEALVRWRHPQRGTVPPVEFIDIAEETGLINDLGAFVLAEACRQLAAWQHQLGDRAPEVLSVNLSRAQLTDPGIAGVVQRALHASGLDARHLQLEVTESLAAQGQQVQSRLVELKALGLAVALDDFGTGYSSLASLHLLPIDVVKIDRSFVSQAETSAHHRVLIEATVRVARSLGMRTVAEGVETAGQAAVLASLHCDKGQGYLYARPMEADAATRWLAAQGAAASDRLPSERRASRENPRVARAIGP